MKLIVNWFGWGSGRDKNKNKKKKYLQKQILSNSSINKSA